MRSRTGTSAINRRKFVAKATRITTPQTTTQPTAPVIVPASTSVTTAGIAVAPPGVQDRQDGKEPVSTNIIGGEIKVDEEGRMDLSEIEKMDPLTASLRGTVVPTEQFAGMAKDVIYNVEAKNQKTMESGLDLLLNPLIKPFVDPRLKEEGVTTSQWYFPEELKTDYKFLPEFMQKGGEGKPPETRSFVEGMSGVIGNVGAIIQSPVAHKIAADEFATSTERFNRSSGTQAYYLGSFVGEIPYFLIGGGTVKAVATISAKTTAGIMKGSVKGTAGLALVAKTYKIERVTDAVPSSKRLDAAAKTGKIIGVKQIVKAVKVIKSGYSDNVIKQMDEILPIDQRSLADDLIASAKFSSTSLGDRFSLSRINKINKLPEKTKAEKDYKIAKAQQFVGEVQNTLLPQLKIFKNTYLGLTGSMVKGSKIARLANVIQGSPVNVATKVDKYLHPPGSTQGDIPYSAVDINADNIFKQNILDKEKSGAYAGVMGNIRFNKDLYGNVMASALGVNRARAKATEIAETFSKTVPVTAIINRASYEKAVSKVDEKVQRLENERDLLITARREGIKSLEEKTTDVSQFKNIQLEGFEAAIDPLDQININTHQISVLQEKANTFKSGINIKINKNKQDIKEQQLIINQKEEKNVVGFGINQNKISKLQKDYDKFNSDTSAKITYFKGMIADSEKTLKDGEITTKDYYGKIHTRKIDSADSGNAKANITNFIKELNEWRSHRSKGKESFEKTMKELKSTNTESKTWHKKKGLKLQSERKIEIRLGIKNLRSEIVSWKNDLKTDIGYKKTLDQIKYLKNQNKLYLTSKKSKGKKTRRNFADRPKPYVTKGTIAELDKEITAIDKQLKNTGNIRERIFTELSYNIKERANRKDDSGLHLSTWGGATETGFREDSVRTTLWRMDIVELNKMFPGFGDTVAKQTIHVSVKPAVNIRKEKGIYKGRWGGYQQLLDITPEQRKTLGMEDNFDRFIDDPGGEIWIKNANRKDVIESGMDITNMSPARKVKRIGFKKVKVPGVGMVRTFLPWKVEQKESMVYMYQATNSLKQTLGVDVKSGVKDLVIFPSGTNPDFLKAFKDVGYLSTAKLDPTVKTMMNPNDILLQYKGFSKEALDEAVGYEAMIKKEKKRKRFQASLRSAEVRDGSGLGQGVFKKDWQGESPLDAVSITIDTGQLGKPTKVPIYDILRQRALVEGDIDAVIRYTKEKDELLDDQLKFMIYRKIQGTKPTGGWSDARMSNKPQDMITLKSGKQVLPHRSIKKMEAKMKKDQDMIDERIKNLEEQKIQNLKWMDKENWTKPIMQKMGVYSLGRDGGTITYMTEFRMKQLAAEHDTVTTGNFRTNIKTGEQYFITTLPATSTPINKQGRREVMFKITDPENFDPTMMTDIFKPYHSTRGGGMNVDIPRNILPDTQTGNRSPVVFELMESDMSVGSSATNYKTMERITPRYENPEAGTSSDRPFTVWSSSGEIIPRKDFEMTKDIKKMRAYYKKMTPKEIAEIKGNKDMTPEEIAEKAMGETWKSDRSAFADIMAIDGGTLDVAEVIERTPREGIRNILNEKIIRLTDPESYEGVLSIMTDDDIGIMKYGKAWNIVKKQKEKLESIDQTTKGGLGLKRDVSLHATNLSIDTSKWIGSKLENITVKKESITDFFMGKKFKDTDMRNLRPSDGLGGSERYGLYEGMVGKSDNVRHVTKDFPLSRIFGVSKHEYDSIKQGEPVGGVVSIPLHYMQDTSYIAKEKKMSENLTNPLKTEKRTNYKVLEDAVIAKSGIPASKKNLELMRFKRSMVNLVQTKIKGHKELPKHEVNEIIYNDGKYKKLVLDVVDRPGNKKLHYPQGLISKKIINRKNKGFINPALDLPIELRSVLPKKQKPGVSTLTNIREQMTPVSPQLTRGSVEPSSVSLVPFLPGKSPGFINIFARGVIKRFSGVKPITTEQQHPHHNLAMRQILEELDPEQLTKELKKDLEGYQSHPNISWDQGLIKLADNEQAAVNKIKEKYDKAKSSYDQINRHIENEKFEIQKEVNKKRSILNYSRPSVSLSQAFKKFQKYEKAQRDRKKVLRARMTKYNLQGRELRHSFTGEATENITADITVLSTTEGGIEGGVKWIVNPDDGIILRPGETKLGIEGKDPYTTPYTFTETKDLLRGMVYKSLGIEPKHVDESGGSIVRGINREMMELQQQGYTKSQAKKNTRSSEDFSKWLADRDSAMERMEPALGDKSADVVRMEEYKRLEEAKARATHTPDEFALFDQRDAGASMVTPRPKSVFKTEGSTGSAMGALFGSRIEKAVEKEKGIGFMSQLSLGLKTSPLVVSDALTTQTEGFSFLPDVNAEPLMVNPQPKNIVDQTISDIQKTISGIEIGSNKIGDTDGLTVKTYTAPASLTGISSTPNIFSMDKINLNNVQIPGIIESYSQTPAEAEQSASLQIMDELPKVVMKVKPALASLLLERFDAPQLTVRKPTLVQSMVQVPPVTVPKPPFVFPINPVIPIGLPRSRYSRISRPRKKDKKKKTWWQTPANWYEPYYWGGKNQEGPGYVTFKGREPGKVRKYEKKYFGIGVGDTPFGIKGSWF